METGTYLDDIALADSLLLAIESDSSLILPKVYEL